MNIRFVNQKGKSDSVEVTRPTLIEASDKQGYSGVKYYIIAKKRANDASPIVIGRFEDQDTRDEELTRIKEAFQNGETEYVVQNAMAVDRDFSKIVQKKMKGVIS